MESMLEPFLAELTIEPGDVIDDQGSARSGFAESVVTLRATRRCSFGSGNADLRWGADMLATGISAATFLDDFWRGASTAHMDALEFGRMLLRRMLLPPRVRQQWDEIQGWRGSRPLRLELILPSARVSPIGAVPFELLADERFLFHAGPSMLVRCIQKQEPRRATIRPGDRLLVAWANPIQLEPQIEDRIFQEHEAALVQAGRAAGLEVPAPVGHSNRARFENALTAHGNVPVVSLLAHGYPPGGRIAFENVDRTPEPVAVSSIAAALRAAGTQVALLWSCHAAGHHAELGSLAELLLDAEVGDLSAVLAAHGKVRADWTAQAAQRIFASLTTNTGRDLELAITHARQVLTEEDPQWAALAYHARPLDGRSVTYGDGAERAIEALLTPRTDRVEDVPRRPYYWLDRPVEIGEITAQVAASRLVTVRGMPGIGKTEVAREAAERLVRNPAFALEAALWIALDDLPQVADLRERIAAWAGLAEPDVPDWRLMKAIGDRRALWVLDNAEDLIRTGGSELRKLLGAILEICPGIRLLVTSQRPIGDLRSEREATYVVRRIDDRSACRQLFAGAAGSPLRERLHSSEVDAILELLDGHPRSLVLVASQVQNGGANLATLLAKLRERGDEAVLAAELLESNTDWSDDDHLRAERLVSSLHLAYRPLLEHAPGAAELFAWLGVLPAGLPVALAEAIFGDDAPARIATLSRFSLVELREAGERLELPAPVRWYAEHRLDADVSAERQGELLARTLDAIAALMTAAYSRLGKPDANAVVESSRREALNLEHLLQHIKKQPIPHGLGQHVARAFWRWSAVRLFGGHHAQQIALLERAQPLVPEEDGKDRASLTRALGDLYLRTGRLADAETAYDQALTAFTAIGDRLSEAGARKALGNLYLRADRIGDAEAAYDKALAAFTAIGDRLGEANTLRALGNTYLRTDRLTDTKAAYGKALEIFEALNNRLGEANTLLDLGDLYLRTDSPADAEDVYVKALAAFAAIDARLGKANTLKALGDLYLRTTRLASAKTTYAKALAAFAAIDDRLGEANTLKALGDLYVRTDRLADAEDAYDRALVAFTEIGAHLGKANTLRALSALYVRTDRLGDAETACDKALAVFEAINERLGEANALLSLGDVYLRTNRLDNAGVVYRKALAAFMAINARLGEANTLSSLGDLELARRRPAKAFEDFGAARTQLLEIKEPLGAGGQLAYMARAARTMKLEDRAIVLGGMALQELRMLDDQFGMALAGHDLLMVAQQAGNQPLARHALLFTWHHARAIEHPLAAELADSIAALLPPAKVEAGLDPDEVDTLVTDIADAVAEAAQRLADAGENPLGPLPQTSSSEEP